VRIKILIILFISFISCKEKEINIECHINNVDLSSLNGYSAKILSRPQKLGSDSWVGYDIKNPRRQMTVFRYKTDLEELLDCPYCNRSDSIKFIQALNSLIENKIIEILYLNDLKFSIIITNKSCVYVKVWDNDKYVLESGKKTVNSGKNKFYKEYFMTKGIKIDEDLFYCENCLDLYINHFRPNLQF
jgi:hypothetical protein